MKRNACKWIFLAMPLALLSCSTDEPDELGSAIIADSIEFVWSTENQAKLYYDESESLVFPMVKGQSEFFAFTMHPQPEELTFPQTVWSSSDPEVVTVDQDGTVTAVGSGTAIVTIQPSTVNVPASASIKIVVYDQLVQATSISVSDNHDLIHEETGLPLCSIGETLQMYATVSPADATYKSVIWSSSNEQIATVDQISGLVTGVSVGRVTITATAIDGSQVKKDKEIYIEQVVNPVGIQVRNIPQADAVFSLSDVSYSFDYDIWPENATRSRVAWKSSDETVATVDDKGNVEFLKYGQVTITATCPDAEESIPQGYVQGFSADFNIPAGFYRDHFLRTDVDLHWSLNKDHIKSGAKQELIYDENTQERYYKFTPFIKNNQGRGDIMRNKYSYDGKTYLSMDYPILCFRFDDVYDRTRDLNGTPTPYPRQINLDTSGALEDGTQFTGNVGGNNNKWIRKYRCSDGSALIIYDLNQQQFPNGGYLPEGKVAAFTTFQIKYADINKGNVFPTLSASEVTYRFFWFHTFRSMAEMESYLQSWSAQTGITYTEYIEQE